MKRILTRYFLGGAVSLVLFSLLVMLAFSIISEKAFPFQKKDEEIALEKSMGAYLKNHFFYPKTSTMKPMNSIDLPYRPELKRALESGATALITREDHNRAMDAMFEEKKVHVVIDNAVSRGLYSIIFSFVLSALFCFGWIKLHDPVLRIFNQYKKGRLYDSLERELSEKGRELHQQTGYTTNWKTKAEKLETAYQALNQKYNTLYSHLKEKQEAEKAAAEKAKQETEEKKAMKERVRKKASALD